jgi:hypothetical protein
MGCVQRLLGGNTLIGWGANDLSVTEVRPDKTTAFELTMGNGNFSYRAFKDVPGSRPLQSVRSEDPIATNEEVDASGISYTLATSQSVMLELYDLLGRKLQTIATPFESAGMHHASFDLRDYPAGSYYCVVRTKEGDILKPVLAAR